MRARSSSLPTTDDRFAMPRGLEIAFRWWSDAGTTY